MRKKNKINKKLKNYLMSEILKFWQLDLKFSLAVMAVFGSYSKIWQLFEYQSDVSMTSSMSRVTSSTSRVTFDDVTRVT